MPLMYTFCTWLPLRLGSIVVGLISLMQSVFILSISIMSLDMTDTISHDMNKLSRSNNLAYAAEIWKMVEKDPRTYLTSVIIYFSLHTISCVMLVYGALQSSIIFLLPYIVLEFMRLCVIFYVVLTSMILIKINVLDFLFLILISVIGVFVLQILIYLWCCPVSLVQCLKLAETPAAASRLQRTFATNNDTVPKSQAMAKIQDVSANDPLSDRYGWRPFKPSYSYPYENMPQYEY